MIPWRARWTGLRAMPPAKAHRQWIWRRALPPWVGSARCRRQDRSGWGRCSAAAGATARGRRAARPGRRAQLRRRAAPGAGEHQGDLSRPEHRRHAVVEDVVAAQLLVAQAHHLQSTVGLRLQHPRRAEPAGDVQRRALRAAAEIEVFRAGIQHRRQLLDHVPGRLVLVALVRADRRLVAADPTCQLDLAHLLGQPQRTQPAAEGRGTLHAHIPPVAKGL